VKIAVQNHPEALEFAEFFNNNEEIVTYALDRDVNAVRFASNEIKSDRIVALNIMTVDGLALRHLSPEFAEDFDIVRLAVKQNKDAFELASPVLQKNPEIIKLLRKTT